MVLERAYLKAWQIESNMNAENFSEPPSKRTVASTTDRGVSRRIGTVLLAIGLAVLAYGAIGFWLIKSLPPNGGTIGRLPSLRLVGIGSIVAIVGYRLYTTHPDVRVYLPKHETPAPQP